MFDNSQFNILIIDDEMFNIEVIIGFLEDAGYGLSFETNPQKGLKRIFSENFDLILLDINMPQMSGLDLCKRIKNDTETKDIPVIFLSAFNDTKTITDAFNLGGVDYITKPFNGLELIARVHTHIELRKYIRELQVKQEKLAKLASTDSITGLSNRIRFISILKKEILNTTTNPTRLTMVYLKIDNLQRLITMYGYKNGDKILLEIAKIVKKNTKKEHTIARIYHSDFVILMPSTSEEATIKRAKVILNALRTTTFINTQITCSIGVGEYGKGEEHEFFIHRVEKVALEISEGGGNMISSLT
ncbi:response regulator [Sulfurimonas sp. SAG-AH-194-I05]|nr:response regulator [Sulfurimonas sp. SAG-AH-194-I05]MDF1875556.1 response regulator [Sulfurimonas sp. SAG-AH-194-I05]